MPKTLQEYVAWLDNRDDLIWPQPPKLVPVNAKPLLKPVRRVKAVIWSLYGTLLRITDGELLPLHHTELRMQVALEKTINEFNMWNSMTRRPGAPWEYMLQKYKSAVEDLELVGGIPDGNFAHVNSTDVWRRLLDMLAQKEYSYDRGFYGDMDELAEKVACYFQFCLQGVEAAPHAVKAMKSVARRGLVQGMLADAQPFSMVQALRAFGRQDKLPPLNQLFDPGCLVLSYQAGVRKPSPLLYEQCLQRLAQRGIEPSEVLYVGNRLQGDVAVARRYGMKTVLYAGDKTSLKASSTEINHPELKPKRLVTDLKQIRDLLAQ